MNDANDSRNILSIIEWYLEKNDIFIFNENLYELILIDGKVYWYDLSSNQTFQFTRTEWKIQTIQNKDKTTDLIISDYSVNYMLIIRKKIFKWLNLLNLAI